MARRASFANGAILYRNRVRSLIKDIEKTKPEVLNLIGVRILSYVHQDYVEKSQGETGEDGVKWDPPTVETLRNRARYSGRNPDGTPIRRREYQTILNAEAKIRERAEKLADDREKLWTQWTPLVKDRQRLRRQRQRLWERWKGARGRDDDAATRLRRSIRQRYRTSNKAAAKISKSQKSLRKKYTRIRKQEEKLPTRRETLRARRNKLFDRFVNNAAIGWHTGRLIRSLAHGRPMAKEDQLIEVRGNVVTVGSNLFYAGYFDEDRQIASSKTITPKRRKAMQRLVRNWMNDKKKEHLG